MNQEHISDSPNVIALPPLIYGAALLLGLILHWVWPLDFLPGMFPLPWFGAAIVFISIILAATALKTFAQTKTNVDVRKPALHVVTNGPYLFTRNPMYLSMTLLVMGIAVWLNELWFLLALILTVLIVRYGVIGREENYLERKFGEEYIRYKHSVRRWL